MVSIPPAGEGPRPHVTAPVLLVDGRIIARRYRLGALIGRGAQGEVYRAIQIDLERPVALKLLAPGVDEHARERFQREARLTAELKHPGVVVVYDAGVTAEGQPYCAMELLTGETLAERIQREGRVPAEELVPIAAGICSALEAAHARKIVHRDVKPSNVFLARRQDGGIDPKLIDFGIAKSTAVDAPEVVKRATLIGLGKRRTPIKTVPGVIAGTPVYLSPEQIVGESSDARSDLYSLSVTLYEALTGAPPFDVPDVSELLIRILYEEPESPELRAPDAAIPRPLAAVVVRGLSKEPERRFASASDLANALWSALAEAKGARPPSDPPQDHAATDLTRAPVERDRRPWLVALLLAVALIGFGLLRLRPQATAASLMSSVAPGPSAAITPSAAPPPSSAPAPSASTAPVAPAPLPPVIDVPRSSKSARVHASQALAPPAAPAPPPPAPSSTGYRIDDLKTPF